jgi:hypothetical protein
MREPQIIPDRPVRCVVAPVEAADQILRYDVVQAPLVGAEHRVKHTTLQHR